MAFAAKYPGECIECGERFEVGAWITFTDNDEICHSMCPPPPKPSEVCPQCYLEMPASGVCSECE